MGEEPHLIALRELLAQHDIGYYLVLTQDEHVSEYVSDCDKRREFISGFTGSAGTAIIGQDYAELATDGRYYLAAGQQLSKSWTLRKEGFPGVSTWSIAIAARAAEYKLDIGVDPKFISYSTAKLIMDELKGTGASLKPIEPNLVDKVWQPKPSEPTRPVYALSDTISGQSSASKLTELCNILQAKKVDAIVLSALDEIAWLFNLRGSDIAYNPVFKSYAIVTADEKVTLYIDSSRLQDKPARATVKPYGQVFSDLVEMSNPSFKWWLPSGSSWALALAVGGQNANLVEDLSPVALAKAKKNTIEISGAKIAQKRCGLSIVRYLTWLSKEVQTRPVSEYEGSMKLLAIRQELPGFKGESFPSISSTGANAAIIHYSPPVTGGDIISQDKIYLLDSGCQFLHGTTDTTRTVHFGKPSNDERKAYTLVLKGHIALSTAVFPQGTYGYQLDPFARQFLWSHGLDFRHGTGHGVGAFLNVHEGPIGISSNPSQSMKHPLELGNIVSNEPGFYEDGEYGIRIESLLVVQSAKTAKKFGNKEYFQFETITLVPFDRNLIDESLITISEAKWINDYHQRVKHALWKDLDDDEKKFVEYHCSPVKSI